MTARNTAKVFEIEPPRKLVMKMRALWSDDVNAEGTSRGVSEMGVTAVQP